MVVQNTTKFHKNNSLHEHMTQAKNKVHVERVELSLAQKGPHYSCSKVYNHLEPFITKFATTKNIRQTLKSLLCLFPFYSMDEFFDTPCKDFIKSYKLLIDKQ